MAAADAGLIRKDAVIEVYYERASGLYRAGSEVKGFSPTRLKLYRVQFVPAHKDRHVTRLNFATSF